jgi:hypothetical protein
MACDQEKSRASTPSVVRGVWLAVPRTTRPVAARPERRPPRWSGRQQRDRRRLGRERLQPGAKHQPGHSDRRHELTARRMGRGVSASPPTSNSSAPHASFARSASTQARWVTPVRQAPRAASVQPAAPSSKRQRRPASHGPGSPSQSAPARSPSSPSAADPASRWRPGWS